MPNIFDTICAIITPPGHSAVAMLRISGSQSIEIVCQFFSNAPKLLKAASHTMHYGTFRDESGVPIDDVVCLLYRNPHSYTGEDSIEISCHGNPLITNRILGVLLTRARMAEAGEFTRRAFLNGKMDLTQAEAVADVISAPTVKSELAALMQNQGLLVVNEAVRSRTDTLLGNIERLKAGGPRALDGMEHILDHHQRWCVVGNDELTTHAVPPLPYSGPIQREACRGKRQMQM